ncbi:MAG: hypothetical protein U0Q18_14770 [Bryobacteraceae bacterium]
MSLPSVLGNSVTALSPVLVVQLRRTSVRRTASASIAACLLANPPFVTRLRVLRVEPGRSNW